MEASKQTPLEIDEQQLLLALLKTVAGSWVAPSQFERMGRDLGIPDGPAMIYFMTGLKALLRELPFKVYTDESSRSAIMDAVQKALDNLIAREESEEENPSS
jgi:type III secretion protein W